MRGSHVTWLRPWTSWIVVYLVFSQSLGSAQPPKHPLQSFEHLSGGSWVVTAATGKQMHHRWKWGPGKYSIERWTEGESAQGEPWREWMVYYWDPSTDSIKFLGISPFASGVNQGEIQWKEKTAVANSILKQSSGVRIMQTRWDFKNNDAYVETLLERNADGKFYELVSLEHHRSGEADTPTHTEAPSAEEEMIPPPFSSLRAIFGNAESVQWDGSPKALQTEFHWVPHASFYWGGFYDGDEKRPEGKAKGFFYQVPDATKPRFLVLAEDSDVYEGEWTLEQNGSVRFEAQRFSREGITEISSTLEKTSDGRLLQTLRSSEQSLPLPLLIYTLKP